jgi:glycosyltransferase involved in cell wall biosynthesis
MRFLHFNTHDIRGGAAQAAYDLHRNLKEAGHQSTMVVQHKASMDPDVIEASVTKWKWRIDRWFKRYRRIRREVRCLAGLFNFDDSLLFGRKQLCVVPRDVVDVVCVHLCDGLLTTRSLHDVAEYYGTPVLVTLMDQEPITGGCHYSMDCAGYTERCGNCPVLSPSGPRDESRRVWLRKKKCLSKLKVQLRTGSEVSARRARSSGLHNDKPVTVLAGPIDERVFRPIDKRIARDLLRLPQDRTIAVFGASMLDDPRKGMDHLNVGLRMLGEMMDVESRAESTRELLLVGVGHGGRSTGAGSRFEVRFLEPFRDEVALALVYQCGDMFINPSLQDEGPVMLGQAMMCGTPPVTYPTDLAKDIVRTAKNGFLCAKNDPGELARGILHLLNRARREEMARWCCKDAMSVFDRRRFTGAFTNICIGMRSDLREGGRC